MKQNQILPFQCKLNTGRPGEKQRTRKFTTKSSTQNRRSEPQYNPGAIVTKVQRERGTSENMR